MSFYLTGRYRGLTLEIPTGIPLRTGGQRSGVQLAEYDWLEFASEHYWHSRLR